VIVLPFVNDTAAQALGFEGAKTDLWAYIENSKLLGGGNNDH